MEEGRLDQNSSAGRARARRLTRSSSVALIAAGALALASGSALARPASLHSVAVANQVPVGPMKLASVTEQCPPSAPHPVGPEYSYATSHPVGSVVLAGSYPTGRRGWVTQVENLTSQPQQMWIGVLCLRASGTFAYPRAGGGLFVDTSGPNYGQTNCPRTAPNAIDGYFGVRSAADAGTIALFESYPYGRKLSGDFVGIKGFSSLPVEYFAGAACTNLPTAVGYYAQKVAAHSRSGLGVNCPRGTPIAAGATFYAQGPRRHPFADDGSILMDFTFTQTPERPRTWWMGVTNLTGLTVRYESGAVCV
jgi:hypothetical protein